MVSSNEQPRFLQAPIRALSAKILWGILAALAILAGAPTHASGDQSTSASTLYGKPEVTKFKDGKLGAFTMQFDDSMVSQAEVAVPELNKRGLVATFFVNPAKDRYQQNRETWEVTCPKFGHELANHTMNHTGAKDYAEAEHEIGECSRHIWRLYPNRSKLLPFARGGGTTWGVEREQIQELTSKYLLFRRPSLHSIADEYGSGEKAASYAEEAIREGKWVPVHFHGVGGEWISVSRENFVKLLDYLAEHQDKLWVATCGDAYKYTKEYEALRDVTLAAPRQNSFTIELECDASKLETYGQPVAELYDEPLTVRTRVPDSWTAFSVRQGDDVTEYATVDIEGRRVAQFQVRPNIGPAVVTRDD